MHRLKRIPDYLTLIYFSDIACLMLSVMVWGDFPHTNPATVALVNAALNWMMVKTIAYAGVVIAYNVCEKHVRTIENIMAVFTVLYAIFVFFTLLQMGVGIPAYTNPVVFNATDIIKI